MRTHSKVGPSSAKRWLNCAGSVRLIDALPESLDGGQSSPAAAEGTKAHALAERMLLAPDVMYADVLPEGMEDAVRVYVRYITDLMAQDPSLKLLVEERVTLRTPPDLTEPMYGTADAILYNPAKIINVDLKYGVGIVVEVVDNPQLPYYLIGAIRKIREIEGDNFLLPQPDFWATIVQPRVPHPDGTIRSVHYTLQDLVKWQFALWEGARRTQDPDAPLTAGDWCQFCPAAAHCPALKQHTALVAQATFDDPVPAPPGPETLSLEQVTDILSKMNVIERWADALRARLAEAIQQGYDARGWKLVQKRPLRVWANEDDFKMYAEVVGVETHNHPVLKSPAQVEKEVGKAGLPPELVAYVSSGLALAPASDPRPAVSAAVELDALPPGEETTEPIEENTDHE